MMSVYQTLFLLIVSVSSVHSLKVGINIIHMHGVTEGYYEHVNFKKFIEGITGIPVHLLDVSNLYCNKVCQIIKLIQSTCYCHAIANVN